MKIDLTQFSIGASHDGEMTLDHDVKGCWDSVYLHGGDHCPTIARAIELAEEHMETCPLRVREEDS